MPGSIRKTECVIVMCGSKTQGPQQHRAPAGKENLVLWNNYWLSMVDELTRNLI